MPLPAVPNVRVASIDNTRSRFSIAAHIGGGMAAQGLGLLAVFAQGEQQAGGQAVGDGGQQKLNG